MSNQHELTPLGFLLLRDGHAVPLSGVSPDDLKGGAKHRVPNPSAEPLRHRQTLNAIVDRLGFSGDFGDFKNRGWEAFNEFLRKNACSERARLFPSDRRPDRFFLLNPTRRQLADRIFESNDRIPQRVFLGYGIDWLSTWDQSHYDTSPVIASIGGDPSTAVERVRALTTHRWDLEGQWGFIDDKLIWGPVENLVNKRYWPPGSNDRQRKESHAKLVAAVQAFRAVFDTQPEGWVDVLRYNDHLVVLRAQNGAWDVLWRAYREHEPPPPPSSS